MPAVPSDLDNIDQLCEEAIRQRLELRIMSANRDSLRAKLAVFAEELCQELMRW